VPEDSRHDRHCQAARRLDKLEPAPYPAGHAVRAAGRRGAGALPTEARR